MKKIVFFVILATFVAGGAMAQTPTDSTEVKKEDVQKEKKKGGFLKGLAKAVESTTGLDVSKEVLFVYPKIGEWKFEVISCIGNKATGEVVLKLKVLKILDGDLPHELFFYSEVYEAGTKNAIRFLRSYSSEVSHDFKIGVAEEVAFQAIKGVPEKVKALDIVFCTRGCSTGYIFEGRSIPVEWK
ncbi:MAG: hypothetical protein LBN95_01900 [Prevotellaceae bacterium]|nr:hypothetical protein [Prevotellaceae bacterium]